MKVKYRKCFYKDLVKIPDGIRGKIENYVHEIVPIAKSLSELGKVEKLKGSIGY